MKRSSFFFAVLFVSLLSVLADAQMGKKRKKDTGGGSALENAKIYKNKAVDVEFKVPKKWKVRERKGRGRTKAEIQSTGKVRLSIELMVFPAQKLEDAREMLIKQLSEQHPASTHRIRRQIKYGGMPALTITFQGVGGSGDIGLIYSVADVPYHGLIALKFQFPKEDLKGIEKIHKWTMDSFRMSGEEGENLLFQPRVVDYDTGLSFRIPFGVVEKKKAAPTEEGAPIGPIYEGQVPGGAYMKIEKVDGAGDGKLRDLMKDWGGGAKPIGNGTDVTPLTEDGEAACLKFPKYSGRPERAFAAFRPNDTALFRIEIAGGDDSLQDAERMAATIDWHDIAKEEAEVGGWQAELNKALKAKEDDRKAQKVVRKIGRKITKLYYLKNARVLARAMLKRGQEKPQIYAMETLGKGGSPLEDFKPIRACMGTSKFKTRTKMRIKGCEALSHMVELKVTSFLMAKVRDKDTKVGKAAILALGHHKGNRKKIIPNFISAWQRVLKDGQKKDPKKQMKRSRLADAYRTALSMLMGIEVKEVADAKKWYSKNRKELVAEQLIKLK